MAFGVMMIDMFFHVPVALGVMMIDVLCRCALGVMAPSVMAIAVPTVMPITVPTVIPIPVTIRLAMLVAVPVRITVAFVPSGMMSRRVLVLVVVASVVSVPFIAPVTIRPSVAPKSQGNAKQRDTDP